LLALALVVQSARSGEGVSPVVNVPVGGKAIVTEPARPTAAEESTYAIYSLADLGDDPELGQWIAETIPAVIEPGSWNLPGTNGKKQVLRYYAPKRVLVVYHTPAVQAKVDNFLKGMKKAMPTGKQSTATAGKTATKDPAVVPAQYLAPAPIRASSPVPEPTGGYPVPAPAQRPKHLFHFIIRYEGDGIIDENVVKFMKAQNGQGSAADKTETSSRTEPPTAAPPTDDKPKTTGPVAVSPADDKPKDKKKEKDDDQP
jgi:hypothetical protein